MAPGYKDKDKDGDGGVVFAFSGKWVSLLHTIVGYTAFLSALIVGISLHYEKIVKNEWFGYPQEWFPSVSAAIGDRYPERSFFMFFIAMSSGPRFALIGLWYLLTRNRPGQRTLSKAVASIGAFRTVTCAGWTYITSTDNHDWHDIFMISYLVATLPWTLGCIALSPPNNKQAIRWRKRFCGAFFGTIVPMIYFYIQHKVHRVPGAYTQYSFFEWTLVLYDVAFDTVTMLDFDTFEVVIRDVKGTSKGYETNTQWLPSTKHDSMEPSAVIEKEKEMGPLGINTVVFSWADALDTAAEVYHGYIFWSILTSLGVVVWYFPLWHMGISGFEAFIMATTTPALLCIRPLRSLILGNLRIVHLLSLAGIAAYLVPNPTLRLCVVGLGVGMTCLGWAASLYADSTNPDRLESKVVAWGIGLILSSTIKYAFQTNNPVWPIMHAENGGWNGIGLAVSILAALRFTRKAPWTSSYPSAQATIPGSSLLAACGIGGLFFGMHSLLSDTSTMILWTWDGYPVNGPLSTTHGWLTVAAMTFGLFLGVLRPSLSASWTSWHVGGLGIAILTCYRGWTGYYGALTSAIYLMAISVPLITNASRKNPAVTFGLGFLIYNFLVLFHVWVVAYAFVPGGPLVREHTDWVNVAMTLLIGGGVMDLSIQSQRKPQTARRLSYTQALHRKYLSISSILVNILFLCAAFRRFPTNDYKPYHAEDRVLTAGIWTIHFSLDNNMWSSERRIGNLLRELEVDVVGLLESDLQRIIMGNRDTTQYLAEELGMYVDYGPGPNQHTWGAALLSKFPIVNSTHHLLPSPVGELAPAIHATIDAYGELVDVFVFHSGQDEDPMDRKLQSEYLAGLMGSTSRPSILLSYLVTKPLKGNYQTYVSPTSGMHDVDPSDWDRWCEYILFKHMRRVGYARVSRGTITDTELQLAKFVVPHKHEMQEVRLWEEDVSMRNRKVNEKDVPEGLRFPELFRGRGVRGHRYHVFNEPRYFS